MSAFPVDRPLSDDPLWPRTGGWPTWDGSAKLDFALMGIPTHALSLSPSRADVTPDAIRDALRRYSGHTLALGAPGDRRGEREVVLDEDLRIADVGDVAHPDSVRGERAAVDRIHRVASESELVVLLGGDNSLTVPGALGVLGSDISAGGLITIDAHHDLRDGRSNGSPVRRLIESGMDPRRVVQIGIADFANSSAYRRRALDWGITVIRRDELFHRSLDDVIEEALGVAGAGGVPIYVDIDVDVCDRSVAPACPASLPGGLQAHELRGLARRVARSPLVRGVDIAEIDATADTADARTVRLAALTVLELATGLSERLGR